MGGSSPFFPPDVTANADTIFSMRYFGLSGHFGTVRPWGKALFWFLLFVAGAYAAAEMGETKWVVISVVVGLVVAILVYILNRELTIGVTEVTATTYPLVLKRSVIEGQEISEAKLAEISQIFVALLDAHKAAQQH